MPIVGQTLIIYYGHKGKCIRVKCSLPTDSRNFSPLKVSRYIYSIILGTHVSAEISLLSTQANWLKDMYSTGFSVAPAP